MSEENVELVRRAFRLYETGDHQRFAETIADDCVISGPEEWPEPGPFEGKSAVMGQFERLASDWAEHHFSDLTVVADEGDWVVWEYRWHTRGAGSGIETTVEMASAHRVVAGRQVEAHFRWNPVEALEAAGLRE
jgi:ketosteroid isomerase-like protein